MHIMNHTARSALLSSLFMLLLAACSPDGGTDAGDGQTNPPQAQAPAPPPIPEAGLVIHGGILLDMTAEQANPTPVKGIVVRDGMIDRIIAADSSEPLPRAAEIIDAGDGYILPGYIDSHVHFRPWTPDAGIWRRASLYYGITTLFDTGPCGDICDETGQDPNEWIDSYRDFMNSGETDGPTLYITGKRFDGPEGVHPQGVQVHNRDEIVRYMDSLVELGVDGFKVEKTLPPDLRAMVIEEANARGLPVVGHSKDARESIDAGMKFIEHMWPIGSSTSSVDPGEPWFSPQHDHLIDLDNSQALIKLMVDNGVFINPTMVGRYGYFSDTLADAAREDAASFEFGGVYSDMPERDQEAVLASWARAGELEPEVLETYKEGLEKVNGFLKMLSDAGGKVLAATDSGDDKMVGVTMHREMKMLAAAGIEPYRVLLGATRWPAENMNKEDQIGTLEAGKQADIVLLGSNPVEEIDNTTDIRYVIRKGKTVREPDYCSVILPPLSRSCE